MRKEEIDLDGESYYLYIESQNNTNYSTNKYQTFEHPYIQYTDKAFVQTSNSSYSIYRKTTICGYAQVKLFNLFDNISSTEQQPFGILILDKEFTDKKINNFLIQHIQEDYQSITQGIFVLALNDTIDTRTNLFPIKEFQPSKKVCSNKKISKVDRLNLDSDLHLKLFQNYAKYWLNNKKMAVSPYGLELYYTYLYSEFGLKDCIYYFPELSAIAIAKQKNRTLHLYEVFSVTEVDLDIVIKSLSNIYTDSVTLGFSPRTEGYVYTEHKQAELKLFASAHLVSLVENNKLMIPILSHI
ncbi:MAG: hypothetical protein LBI72_15115 [Flavobacteriaceae bacterium]|jgi:hypothetical protein|nr:hypothetical protein [Flavobacteriaceae bacterium]